jgi:hypothetical protein
MDTEVEIRTHLGATIRNLKELIAEEADLPDNLSPTAFVC